MTIQASKLPSPSPSPASRNGKKKKLSRQSIFGGNNLFLFSSLVHFPFVFFSSFFQSKYVCEGELGGGTRMKFSENCHEMGVLRPVLESDGEGSGLISRERGWMGGWWDDI